MDTHTRPVSPLIYKHMAKDEGAGNGNQRLVRTLRSHFYGDSLKGHPHYRGSAWSSVLPLLEV